MTQLTIEPIPTGWRAFYDAEGLVGEGVDREAAIVDLLEQTTERWDASYENCRDAMREAKEATDKRDRKQEILSYVIQTLLDAFPGMDKCAPAEAIARKVAKRHADVTRERDEANKALEEAESEREAAVAALLAVRPYINMEAYVRIADEALKRGKPDEQLTVALGPELGRHDALPCDVRCKLPNGMFSTFGKGVTLGTLLDYLARRVTENNATSHSSLPVARPEGHHPSCSRNFCDCGKDSSEEK